jgi:hypothetical protein
MRGAAERGRGQHVPLASGAGDWRVGASRKRSQAGSPLDGSVRGLIDRARRRILSSRPQARSSNLANTRSQAEALGDGRGSGVGCKPCPRHVRSRDTGPTARWSKLWRGKRPRRAPADRPPTLARVRSSVNGLPRGAKLRSGRAGHCQASSVRKRRTVVVDAPQGAHLTPPSDHGEPSSLSTRPVGLRANRATGRRGGETGRETLGRAARATWTRRDPWSGPKGSMVGGRTRTRKEAPGPRDRARLLGKGKL